MTFTAIRPDLGLSKGREVSLYLASKGLLHKPALYLSDYFERNKAAYVDHLMAVRQGNHFREWLVFFLFGVEETARASASVFRSVQRLNGGYGLCQGCCLKRSR